MTTLRGRGRKFFIHYKLPCGGGASRGRVNDSRARRAGTIALHPPPWHRAYGPITPGALSFSRRTNGRRRRAKNSRLAERREKNVAAPPWAGVKEHTIGWCDRGLREADVDGWAKARRARPSTTDEKTSYEGGDRDRDRNNGSPERARRGLARRARCRAEARIFRRAQSAASRLATADRLHFVQRRAGDRRRQRGAQLTSTFRHHPCGQARAGASGAGRSGKQRSAAGRRRAPCDAISDMRENVGKCWVCD
ncbi:hypothetical protein GY45DRAFT_57242 [Cubamyces sp. BRFM 1775]|nr:hypothetical protein GY45DRAFT_57242 [Cubamyces sp. BRFM 1775]